MFTRHYEELYKRIYANHYNTDRTITTCYHKTLYHMRTDNSDGIYHIYDVSKLLGKGTTHANNRHAIVTQ